MRTSVKLHFEEGTFRVRLEIVSHRTILFEYKNDKELVKVQYKLTGTPKKWVKALEKLEGVTAANFGYWAFTHITLPALPLEESQTAELVGTLTVLAGSRLRTYFYSKEFQGTAIEQKHKETL